MSSQKHGKRERHRADRKSHKGSSQPKSSQPPFRRIQRSTHPPTQPRNETIAVTLTSLVPPISPQQATRSIKRPSRVHHTTAACVCPSSGANGVVHDDNARARLTPPTRQRKAHAQKGSERRLTSPVRATYKRSCRLSVSLALSLALRRPAVRAAPCGMISAHRLVGRPHSRISCFATLCCCLFARRL
ncbi:hypothetical protein BKA81DRAFT_33157 [Phyllosticta paracitricarpa]